MRDSDYLHISKKKKKTSIFFFFCINSTFDFESAFSESTQQEGFSVFHVLIFPR